MNKQPRYVTKESLDSRIRKLVRAGGTSFVGGAAASGGGGGGADMTAYEPLLGKPAADGHLLASTVAGVRSWRSPHEIRLTPVVSVLMDYSTAASYINSGEPGREYVFVVPAGATGTWAGKEGQLAIYKSAAWRYETPVDYQLVLSSIGLSYSADRRIYQYVAYSSSWVVTDLMIPESSLILADNATGDVSTDQHGFCPKLPGSAVQVFCGDGLFKEIAGAAGAIKVYSKASANLRNSNADTRSTGATTATKVKEVQLNEPVQGVRISFLLQSGYGGGSSVFARIYRNGVAIGTQRATTSALGVTYTEDFDTLWAANDLIQIYAWASSGEDVSVSEMSFLYDRAIAGFGAWTLASASRIVTVEQTAYDMTAQDPT